MSISKLIKSILSYLAIFLLLLIGSLFWLAASDRTIDYEVDLSGIDVPTFDQQFIDFIPSYDAEKTIPFTASAVIDIDGDGVEEVFFGGGIDQNDAFYQFTKNGFVDITAQTNWSKDTPDNTFGSVALDLDNDGDTDLLITRQSGVWLYTNTNGRFSGLKLNLDFDAKSVPLSVAVSDLNRDGLFDMYVSGYIAREHVEGETIFNKVYGGISALYINNGDNKFTNITKESGLHYQHNTFQGMFIDVDDDDLEDLVVAHDTGTVRTWKNLGGLKFKNIPNPTSNIFSYPMGIAVTDYGNNGRPDFFFSNVGSTTPDTLVRGDLTEQQVLNKKWIMFENQGSFEFKDIANTAKLADYEFSWGALFEDFNLDGRDDLVVSENYAGFPLHILPAWRLDGRFLLHNQKGEFAAAGKLAGVQNRLYGISPLTADFNQDGYPDLIHVNLLGPQNVFLSKGGSNQHLKIQLPNTVSSIGAKVVVTLADGSRLHNTFVVGEGLCSDQSHILSFGLGKQSAVAISVRFLNGERISRSGSFANQVIRL